MQKPIFDPPIKAKMQVMARQVCWQHPLIQECHIDQTRLVIGDSGVAKTGFSFLVIGDTDIGEKHSLDLPRAMAAAMHEQLDECEFILHTGDVAYPIGAAEYYLRDFIQPYCGQRHPDGAGVASVRPFNLPVLPVPGNHDYYDRVGWQRVLMRLFRPLQGWLRRGGPIGWPGSAQGRAYAQTFLDCLAQHPTPGMLREHLAQHYTAKTDTGYCLQYEVGKFTRLPNRYYHFRYGGIEFFALDSNTFNQEGGRSRQLIDQAQLAWFQQRLIQSWRDSSVQGRIVYFHHAPYTTETTHYNQPEILAVRRHLRTVLDQVALEVNHQRGDRPLIDLVLNGHAHCFEYVRTLNTGHADADLDWVVCGGSGMSLRSQRSGGADITEMMRARGNGFIQLVARSQMFVGKDRDRGRSRFRHSFVRVDVQIAGGMKLVLRPFVVEQVQQQWQVREVTQANACV